MNSKISHKGTTERNRPSKHTQYTPFDDCYSLVSRGREAHSVILLKEWRVEPGCVIEDCVIAITCMERIECHFSIVEDSDGFAIEAWVNSTGFLK